MTAASIMSTVPLVLSAGTVGAALMTVHYTNRTKRAVIRTNLALAALDRSKARLAALERARSGR